MTFSYSKTLRYCPSSTRFTAVKKKSTYRPNRPFTFPRLLSWTNVFYRESIYSPRSWGTRCQRSQRLSLCLGSSPLIFGRITDVFLCLSDSGKGRRRSSVPTPKWCWLAVSWTWGQMSTPWGNSPSSASSPSPTSRWEQEDDRCVMRKKMRWGASENRNRFIKAFCREASPLWSHRKVMWEKNLTQHNQPPQNQSCVKPLGGMLLGLAFWPKFCWQALQGCLRRGPRERHELVEFMSRDAFFFFFSPPSEMKYSCRFRDFQNAGWIEKRTLINERALLWYAAATSKPRGRGEEEEEDDKLFCKSVNFNQHSVCSFCCSPVLDIQKVEGLFHHRTKAFRTKEPPFFFFFFRCRLRARRRLKACSLKISSWTEQFM